MGQSAEVFLKTEQALKDQTRQEKTKPSKGNVGMKTFNVENQHSSISLQENRMMKQKIPQAESMKQDTAKCEERTDNQKKMSTKLRELRERRAKK